MPANNPREKRIETSSKNQDQRSIGLLVMACIIAFAMVFSVFFTMLTPQGDDGLEGDGNVKGASFTTSDGVELAGTVFIAEERDSPVIVMIHGWDDGRGSWENFANLSRYNGFHALTFNLRGHGDSAGAKNSSLMHLDVEAALSKLDTYFPGHGPVGLMGASIGANLAIEVATTSPVKTIVALSPGNEYMGVNITNAVKNLTDTSIYFVASDEDGYSTTSSLSLFASTTCEKDLTLKSGVGHGTQMLSSQEITQMLANWLETHLRAV